MVSNQQVITPARITPIEIDLYAPFDSTTFFRTFRHASVQVNDIKLHYVIGGEGEPVLAVAETVIGEGVEGSGHFIAEERPDYLAARLLDFFTTARSS